MINIIMQLNENLYMDDFKGAFFLKQLVIARKFPTRSSPFRTTHVFGDTPFVKHVNNYITYINDFKEYRFKENESDWTQKGEKYIQKVKFTLIRQQIIKRQKVMKQFEIDWTQNTGPKLIPIQV